MDLILWRHADAEDGYPDEKRPLTVKGHRQAVRMARWLEQYLPAKCVVLASPALRTQQTAAALGARIATRSELGLAATPDSILEAAQWPDALHAVVVVGHQPTLGMTAARLLTGTESEWSVRKGSIWWFVRDQRHTVLRAVLGPELV
ncbi:MAG: histidine phosphatase family protein [Betaproteobacteria bacterium]|nr:histidine phosphatase family protein [Betaproteobacteria bacterium]